MQVVVALLLGLAGPALAQDVTPRVDLAALVLAGVRDGAEVMVDGETTAVFSRTKPGDFSVGGDVSGTRIIVQEIAPCVFTLHGSLPHQRELTIRFDFNLVSDVSFEPGDGNGPVRSFGLSLAGEGDVVQLETPDLILQALPPHTTITTSVPLAELDAAWATLGSECGPG